MKKRKRERDKGIKPIKINFRFFGAIIIILIALFLKYNPTYLNKTISYITKTNCDFPLMLDDIKNVIYSHTTGHRVFKKPIDDIITSPFGKRENPITKEEEIHTGIDINAAENTEVKAANKGKVIRVEENEFYGKFIMIEHSGNLVSLYGHLNEQSVKPGDEVSDSQIIGLSGSTGRSTGPHLHFEIRKNSECVNPEDYLKWKT